MRVWGRVAGVWQEVTTDDKGFNDAVYITNVAQVLNLNLGESPFFANYGIPAHESIVSSIFPTYYVQRVQDQFAQFFSAMSIQQLEQPYPCYNVNVTTQQGSSLIVQVPI